MVGISTGAAVGGTLLLVLSLVGLWRLCKTCYGVRVDKRDEASEKEKSEPEETAALPGAAPLPSGWRMA